jgi:hypothetical protein
MKGLNFLNTWINNLVSMTCRSIFNLKKSKIQFGRGIKNKTKWQFALGFWNLNLGIDGLHVFLRTKID